ncbi:MAG: aminotransferase class IV [Planctomycetaceae bacterium]|nr:aminotransferase class IV [Planctomycetaceae bacterium]
MPEPTAYLNGKWLLASQAAVSVFDGGFMQGVAVAEQLRTFGGQLFRLDLHLDRLARSLAIIGVDPGLARDEFAKIATDLAAQNHKLLDEGDDLGLSIFVTPGPYAAFAAVARHKGPTVGIHTQPLPFAAFAAKYETGESLVVSDIQQVPAACWPAELKCRSRMHYFLADRQAREREPGARALLLDERGFVTEASTANILVYYRDVGLVSPPRERILPGVTVAVIEELALGLRIPFSHRDLTTDDVAAADEVLLCSTSPCIIPVTRLDGRPIATGRPGPIARQLLAAWSAMVGCDIVAQARQFAAR